MGAAHGEGRRVTHGVRVGAIRARDDRGIAAGFTVRGGPNLRSTKRPGGENNSDSTHSACNKLTKLSHRRTWASSCSSTISSSSGDQPVIAAGGSRIIGRMMPIKTGDAMRSHTATVTRRVMREG